MAAVSPKIRKLSWGRIEVEGIEAPFKDAKLFPGGAREWDWRETGADHRPGVQIADVEELVARGAEVVVLTRGMLGALQIRPETRRWLEERGIAYHIHRTAEAMKVYNRLAAEKRRVGGLFHSTC